MNDIKLLKEEIDKKITKAKECLPFVLNDIEKHTIDISYRIKDKQRILEKVMLLKNKPSNKNTPLIKILNQATDIIGITIVFNSYGYI